MATAARVYHQRNSRKNPRVPHPCDFGFVRVGSFVFLFLHSLQLYRRVASAPSLAFTPLFTTHYSLPTFRSHFSTHFHSHIKPITPRPTPSNPATSASLIRIRASRSNDL